MPRARVRARAAMHEAEAAVLGLSEDCAVAPAASAEAEAWSPGGEREGSEGSGDAHAEESSGGEYGESDRDAVVEDAAEALAAEEDKVLCRTSADLGADESGVGLPPAEADPPPLVVYAS